MGDEVTRLDVQATFDRIAEHFARTRSTPWEQVTGFLEKHGKGDVGLDLGCGNGRHLERLETVCNRAVGIDVSRALLRVAARDREYSLLIQGDATALPLGDECIDIGLYIAAIHHLPTERERRESLNELDRVLGCDAPLLVSCWSANHDRLEGIDPGDRFVPWTLPTGEAVDRYYHLYDLASFRQTVTASTLTIDRIWEADGNCWALCRGR